MAEVSTISGGKGQEDRQVVAEGKEPLHFLVACGGLLVATPRARGHAPAVGPRMLEVGPRQSAGGGPGLGKVFQITTFTFGDHCLEGKLTFGNPLQCSGVGRVEGVGCAPTPRENLVQDLVFKL